LTFRHTDLLEDIGYSDLDFVGCIDIEKFNLGYIFLLTKRVVSWRSTKQTIVVLSTMEEKFIACYEATTHVIWLRNFISGLKVINSISRPITIYCDNSTIVFFSKNNKSESQNKHIDIKYLIVREKVKEHKVLIKHISTRLMIVDPMTKVFLAKQYRDHVH
jgi:hypothetical protein